MIIWLIAGVITTGLLISRQAQGADMEYFSDSDDSSEIHFGNKLNLPDVKPEFQKGNFSKKYDAAYLRASEDVGVPFALLKAHAIRESLQKAEAYRQEPNGKASYGLLQVLWWRGSNRFAQWGYPDDYLGDGSRLYDPVINSSIAAWIILDNWQWTGKNLRDAINAYNTGVKESKRVAPGNYVNDVLKNYEILIGRNPL